ncbi:hypothetical protein BZA70DRAFT_273287 [Myxozyma melibiosi]|uniref:MI domain-containing protein n=1 Tax=Myxozyma melibiosi TaxID=54550 RepID=A0ABR1FEI4_9ASCO
MPRQFNRSHKLPSQRSKPRPPPRPPSAASAVANGKKSAKRRKVGSSKSSDSSAAAADYDPLLKRDEDDILYYSRKLKAKSGKLPRMPEDDGLDSITEGLDLGFLDDMFGSGSKKKSKRASKRAVESSEDEDSEVDEEASAEDGDSDEEIEVDLDSDSEEEEDEDSNDEDDLEEDDSEAEADEADEAQDSEAESAAVQPEVKKRENPYLPPVAATASNGGKYIPPSLRKKMEEASGQSDEARALRRQCHGLLNRLSEANIASIAGEFQQLYMHNARQSVTSTVTSILLEMTAQKSILHDNFVIVYGALVAALYKHVGTDFGAYFIQTLVETFDSHLSDPDKGKECSNLMVMLSQLYTFQVVGCSLIYDFIRVFLSDITELNTELLLKLITNAGSQLRHDDPAALKEIISLLQGAVKKIPPENLNSRTKFLIETVTSWKNNRLTNTSKIASESITRMRKFLGNIPGSAEALRVTLDDIRNVETRGKWWLVGAAWSGDGTAGVRVRDVDMDDNDVDISAVKDILDTAEPDWLALARQQRMNTDIRRAIFVAIMGSEDYVDANERLMSLKLKRVQEREIPRVVLHCCGNEKDFNPFYAYVSAELCKQHSVKKTFQFSLWDYFKELDGDMDEEDDDNDSDDEDTDLRFVGRGEVDEKTRRRKSKNFSKFFAVLVGEGRMGLEIFKNVNFLTSSDEMNEFLQIFFPALVSHIKVRTARQKDRLAGEKALVQLVVKIKDNTVLMKGIEYFLKAKIETKKVSKKSGQEKTDETIKWGVGIICDSIERLERSKEF